MLKKMFKSCLSWLMIFVFAFVLVFVTDTRVQKVGAYSIDIAETYDVFPDLTGQEVIYFATVYDGVNDYLYFIVSGFDILLKIPPLYLEWYDFEYDYYIGIGSTGAIRFFLDYSDGHSDFTIYVYVDSVDDSGLFFVYVDPSAMLVDINNAGKMQGLSDGYNDGYEAGNYDGYHRGNADGYDLGEADGYSAGLSDGYTDGFNVGLSEGYNEGYSDGDSDGYLRTRETYGMLNDGTWYTAKQWGDYRYQVGQSEDFNFFTGLVSLLFSSITAFGNIEILPGFRLSFFVGIIIVFGLIFFIIGKRGGGKD